MLTPRSENGWPVIPAYGDDRLATLTLVHGAKNILAGPVHNLFKAFLEDYHNEVEPIVTEDSWGYSPRKVTQGTNWSNHASGTAVDVNASK